MERREKEKQPYVVQYGANTIVRYLVVGVRGEFVGDDDVRGEEELDTLLGGDLLEFAC
jgi:hypothetical protein